MAVGISLVVAGLFVSVPQGVAEVQEHPQAGVPLVLDHDGSLDGAAGVEDFFDLRHHRSPIGTVVEQVEERPICNTAVLDHLCHAIGKGILRQAVQHVRIYDDPLGLPEGAGQILARLQVDGHLAAY